MKSIGLMSGTSLDGLDICYVEFHRDDNNWTFNNLITKSIYYSDEMRLDFESAFKGNENTLVKLNKEFGSYLGEKVKAFISENSLEGQVDFIASHGHTIFHEPAKGITVQVGSGKEIANLTKLTVINDFRIEDVKLGGQGAPLVPVGDEYLFAQYQACLNLGGFANISFKENKRRIAFDICPCNLPLNKYTTESFHKKYDRGGLFASQGSLITDLIKKLDDIEFYGQATPKSLGLEWLEKDFYPVIKAYGKIDPADLLASLVEHETNQIAEVLNINNIENVLITGGGVYNEYFISRLRDKVKTNIIIPDSTIIEFKEALIFAFLGLLRINETINTFSSVTGARADSIGGIIHLPDSI